MNLMPCLRTKCSKLMRSLVPGGGRLNDQNNPDDVREHEDHSTCYFMENEESQESQDTSTSANTKLNNK